MTARQDAVSSHGTHQISNVDAAITNRMKQEVTINSLTVYGNSKGFEIKVGMHQGSALSPLLFVIVMEAISRKFGVALLYADDL